MHHGKFSISTFTFLFATIKGAFSNFDFWTNLSVPSGYEGIEYEAHVAKFSCFKFCIPFTGLWCFMLEWAGWVRFVLYARSVLKAHCLNCYPAARPIFFNFCHIFNSEITLVTLNFESSTVWYYRCCLVWSGAHNHFSFYSVLTSLTLCNPATLFRAFVWMLNKYVWGRTV